MIPWQQPAGALLNYMIDFTDQLGGDELVAADVTATGGVIVSDVEVRPRVVLFNLADGEPGLATIRCVAQSASGLRPIAEPMLRVTA